MKTYSPPPGYYDLPFTWAFDASPFAGASSPQNQVVYIKGGYGKFIMRRIVGLSRLLDPTTGQYRIRDGMLNDIESVPVFGVSADDIGILPELEYPEQGGVRFDLYNILKPTDQPATAQVAFQGVRRMQGQGIQNPTYKATPKSFTYTMEVNVSAPVGSVTTGRVVIDNYDFELHQLIILVGGIDPDTAIDAIEGDGQIEFANKPTNAPPNNVVTINIPLAVGLNTPFNLSVVGNTINITVQTDGTGSNITTVAQVITAISTSPAANALISTTNLLNGFIGTPFTATLGPGSAGGNLAALTQPVSSLWIYDRNRVQIANMPVLDLFCDGGPGGIYKNGALVTPMWFPKESQIQIDFYSQLNGTTTPASSQVTVYLVGKKYYPC